MHAARAARAVCLAVALAGCGSAPPLSEAEAQRERLIELNDRAQRAVGRGEFKRAAALYREALRNAEAIEDFRAVAINALNLAATYHALGETALSRRSLDRVLAAPARFERRLVAEASGRRVLLALEAGQLDAAAEWLARAENDCRPQECRVQTALLNLRGQLLLEQGGAGEARAVAGRALAASGSEGNREEEANALRLDGRAASRMGEHVQAVAQLSRALEADKQLVLPRKIALDLLALAEAELARGDRGAARDYAQRALDVSRASGSQPQQDAARRLLERVP